MVVLEPYRCSGISEESASAIDFAFRPQETPTATTVFGEL